MCRSYRCWVFALAAAWGPLGGSVQAAILYSYDANAVAPAPDPVSASGGSWTAGGVSQAGNAIAPGSEAGGEYWEIIDTNAGGNTSKAYSKAFVASDLADPAGWTATAVLKVASASATASGVTLDVRGGGKLFNLSFVNTAGNEYVGQSVTGASAIVSLAALDLDGQYNTVQLWYDPSDSLADLYVNGSFISSITAGASGQSRILFGSNTSSATSSVRWREVRFETGFAIVPEPNAAVLLSVLLFAGLGASRPR